MYQKPALTRYGSFRQLTLFGLDSSTDGASIFGIAGCSTTWKGTTYEIGCPDEPTAS